MSKLASLSRDAVLLLLGRYSQFIVTLVSVPLLARALGVSGLASLGVGLAFVLIGSLAVDAGLTQLLAARLSSGQAGVETVAAYRKIRTKILFGLSATSAVFLLVDSGSMTVAAILGVTAGGLSSMNEDWIFIGKRRFGRLAAIQMFARATYLALILAVLPWIDSAWIPLALLCVANGLAAIVSRCQAPPVEAEHELEQDELLRMGLPVVGSRVLGLAYGPSSLITYSLLVPTTVLGLFASSDRVVRAGQSAMDALGLAMMPRIAAAGAMRTRTNTVVRSEALRLLLLGLGLGCTSGIALALLSPRLVPWIFGSEFVDAVPYFILQSAMLPATAVSSLLLTTVLFVIGDSWGILMCSLVGAAGAAVGLTVVAVASWPLSIVLSVLITEYSVAISVIARVFWVSRPINS